MGCSGVELDWREVGTFFNHAHALLCLNNNKIDIYKSKLATTWFQLQRSNQSEL